MLLFRIHKHTHRKNVIHSHRYHCRFPPECARLSCILSFWVHVNLFYRIVSYWSGPLPFLPFPLSPLPRLPLPSSPNPPSSTPNPARGSTISSPSGIRQRICLSIFQVGNSLLVVTIFGRVEVVRLCEARHSRLICRRLHSHMWASPFSNILGLTKTWSGPLMGRTPWASKVVESGPKNRRVKIDASAHRDTEKIRFYRRCALARYICCPKVSVRLFVRHDPYYINRRNSLTLTF